MNRFEYRSLDKSEWEDGPWMAEPDKVQWYDDATDLPCLIVRTPHSGHLCGYVGVRPGHPWHGKHYDDVEVPGEEYGPDVHGGLTFAGPCNPQETPEIGICHIPKEGDTDDIWWLGFDCAHCDDYSRMAYAKKIPETRFDWEKRSSYKDVGFVEAEVAKLAAQAAKVGEGLGG